MINRFYCFPSVFLLFLLYPKLRGDCTLVHAPTTCLLACSTRLKRDFWHKFHHIRITCFVYILSVFCLFVCFLLCFYRRLLDFFSATSSCVINKKYNCRRCHVARGVSVGVIFSVFFLLKFVRKCFYLKKIFVG